MTTKHDISEVIKENDRRSLLLTMFQCIFLSSLFTQVVHNPIKALLNPINLVQSFYYIRNILFLLSGCIYIYIRFVLRRKECSFIVVFLSFALSHFLFNNSILSTELMATVTQETSFFKKKIPINVNYLFNILTSVISGIICATRFKYAVNNLRFTHIQGIFIYFFKTLQELINNVINLYFVDLVLSYWAVFVYLLLGRFLINFVCIFLRIQLVYKSMISVFKHLVVSNTSVFFYYIFMEILDRLLVYNASILDKRFIDFYLSDDLYNMRYMFFQISGLCYKYSYVLREIAKSNVLLQHIEDYARIEVEKIKVLLKELREEKKQLQHASYMVVPQISPTDPKESEKGNTVKKHSFVKKVSTFNFIEKVSSKIFYYFKSRYLLNKFYKSTYFVEELNTFMNFLVKHKINYLLLEDVDRRWSEIYKDIIEDIRETEKLCEVDLKVKI